MKKATNCPCGKPLRWSDQAGKCQDCRDAEIARTKTPRYTRDTLGTPERPQQGVSENMPQEPK